MGKVDDYDAYRKTKLNIQASKHVSRDCTADWCVSVLLHDACHLLLVSTFWAHSALVAQARSG